MTITIVDYGLGNTQAFVNIYKQLGVPVELARTAGQLEGAEKIILPGVGSFDWAIQKLDISGMRQALDYAVLEQRRPVLGVCVGMQMMARSSEEGERQGLGWLDAKVKRFDSSHSLHKFYLPHMGWNDVKPTDTDTLFEGLGSWRFYFLHSYYFSPQNPAQVLAVTEYHDKFPSAVRSGNIFGVQFHPEKSHQWGVQLLKNFAAL